ncbi:hypothetical protein V502_03490 [Pseudogymnoascus sp. VKM F-4520 (FW-2644)]|nr:hypothetical protein V502_03490 [Pseudogymnoascus sp. VKM F-4520 (FW-2644)]
MGLSIKISRDNVEVKRVGSTLGMFSLKDESAASSSYLDISFERNKNDTSRSITEGGDQEVQSSHGIISKELPSSSEKQTAASLHYVPEDNNPPNTTSAEWTYGKYLAAAVGSGDGMGKLPPSAKMSVLFSNLIVIGAGSGAAYQGTVGRSALAPLTAVKGLFSSRKSPQKTILYEMDGIIRSSEMLLVLGRPGSGCSTLLKNLAGFNEGYLRCDGDIKYNGVDVEIIKRQFRREVVYNAEVEAHFPHLNVGHTLDFAVESRTPGPQRSGKSTEAYVRENTDVLATTFGLRHTLKTKVGNDFIRGVSSGERKRVSIAEVLRTRASVCYWDNPTRSLDASTALELAITLRSSTSIAQNTAIVAAYQAGENFTSTFNKVTILYVGRQIFFGALQDAKTHFNNLGFERKSRQTTADFLTALTDLTGRRVRSGFEHKAPRSPEDFVKAWKESIYFAQLQTEIKQYSNEFGAGDSALEKFKLLQSSQKAKRQRAASPYIADIQGDKAYVAATSFSAIFTAVINGSVFVNTTSNTSGFFSKGGVLFFCVLFNALQTISEVATQYEQRKIVQKHKGFAMYHPFVDSLASIFADWPFKAFNVILFDVIIYFMVGLKKEAGAFFIFVLVTYLTTIAMSGLFRTVAAATNQSEAAKGIAGIFVLILSIYTGYVIPVPSMHPWFSWLRYINPVSYGFEAIMVNEFHGQMGQLNGAQSGQSFVSGDAYLSASFEYEYSYLWRNVGIMIGFAIFFVITCAIATELNPLPPSKGEFLVFREGHEPKSVKRAVAEGKTVEDLEDGQEEEIILATAKTNVLEFYGLMKSEDMFTWEHINYDIVIPGGVQRRLLNDVTGYVKPGTLTALMGESGAGKTTLLNVLA